MSNFLHFNSSSEITVRVSQWLIVCRSVLVGSFNTKNSNSTKICTNAWSVALTNMSEIGKIMWNAKCDDKLPQSYSLCEAAQRLLHVELYNP